MELLKDYTDFCTIRQNTFYEKQKVPEYINPILGTSKFTNIYRILDRVSQYELKNVIYSGVQNKLEILFRVFVFNHFKTEAFINFLSESKYKLEINSFNPLEFAFLLDSYSNSDKIYTNAYIVPGSAGESKALTTSRKAWQLIKLINSSQLDNITSSFELFNILKSIKGIGDFMASQVVFDCLWHESYKNFDRLYILGDGAKRGAFKLGLIPNLNPNYDESKIAILKAQKTLLDSNFQPITFKDRLNVQDLFIYPDAGDIQNTFCETDKLFRLTHPELLINNKQARIKNQYKPGKPNFQINLPGWWIGLSYLIKLN